LNPESPEMNFTLKSLDGTNREFRVAAFPGMTFLDALIDVYRTQDNTLGFRYSCTVGRCFSCLIRVDGKAVVACREPMHDGATLEAMKKRAVLRDLVTDDSSTRTFKD
jgi:succinate dehydrogenase/fumarate reductase-like Fe-S protein